MKKRVLVIYHNAALESSRRLFAAMAESPQIRLRVLGPYSCYDPGREAVLTLPSEQSGSYDLVGGRIRSPQRGCSGPYLTGLARELRRFRPDIVHVFNEPYMTLSAQVLLYSSVLRRAARCYAMGVENILPAGPRSRRDKFVWHLAQSRFHGVACWSSSAKEALESSGFPGERLHLTYWGIPLDLFESRRSADLRRSWGLEGAFVIGYVGRIEISKGLMTLLLAMRVLPGRVHCVMVGGGSWEQEMSRQIESLNLQGRVRLIPRVEDGSTAAYMNAFDALVLPSETTAGWKEQFGRVLPEAMACGLPVIGSSSGAIPEIVGDAGLVFAERDYVRLAAAVRELDDSAEMRDRLGRAGIERAKNLFSCQAFAKALLRMYGLSDLKDA